MPDTASTVVRAAYVQQLAKLAVEHAFRNLDTPAYMLAAMVYENAVRDFEDAVSADALARHTDR